MAGLHWLMIGALLGVSQSPNLLASEVRPFTLQDSFSGPYSVVMTRGTVDAGIAFPKIPDGAKIVKAYACFFTWFEPGGAPDTLTAVTDISSLGNLILKRSERDKIPSFEFALYLADVTTSAAELAKTGTLRYQAIAQKYDSGSGFLVVYEDNNLPWQELKIYTSADILESTSERANLTFPSIAESVANIDLLFPYKTTVSGQINLNNAPIVPRGSIFPDQPIGKPFVSFQAKTKHGDNVLTLGPDGFMTLAIVVLGLQSPVLSRQALQDFRKLPI